MQEENRQQDHHVYEHCVDDGTAHLEGGLQDDAGRRPVAALLPMLAQTPHDVLHVDDRIVNDDADGDYQPRKDQHIKGGPEQGEHEAGS